MHRATLDHPPAPLMADRPSELMSEQRHAASHEHETLPLSAPILPSNPQCEILTISLADISLAQWTGLRTQLRLFAIAEAGEHAEALKCERFADSAIDSIRAGHFAYPARPGMTLIEHLQSTTKMKLDEKLAAYLLKKQLPPVEILRRPSNRQRRAKRIGEETERNGAPITVSMDVEDVISNLPMMALLVSRLNDLLNPVANPAPGRSGGAL
jgi:hypothetical protein